MVQSIHLADSMNGIVQATTVRITGAGIAGRVLKRELEDRGIPVRLTDADTFPRQKVCGGVLQPDTWEYLRRRFDLALPVREIHHAAFYWQKSLSGRHRLKTPWIYASRFDLDASMGACDPAANAPRGNDDVTEAAAATAGAPLIRAEGKGAGDWIGLSADCDPVEELKMILDDDLYLGVSPTAGPRAHAAILIRPAAFKGLDRLTEHLASKLGVTGASNFKGTRRIRYGRSHPAVLSAGDAILRTHPFLGFGMKHAVLSARMLAECIAEGRADEYPAMHRRAFRIQAAASSVFESLYRFRMPRLISMVCGPSALYRPLHRCLHGL